MSARARQRQNQEAAARIVATLFSFACLAERASGQIWFVRIYVLWTLRSAITVAQRYVIACLGPAELQAITRELDPIFPADASAFSAQEAIRVALYFRALALLLTQMSGRSISCADSDFSTRHQMLWLGARAILQIHAKWLDGATALSSRRPEVRAGLPPGFT